MFVKISKNNLTFQFALLVLFSLVLWGKAFVTGGFSQGACWAGWAVCLLMAAGTCFMVQKQQVSRNPGMQGLIFLCLTAPHLGTEYTPQIWVYPLFLLSFYYTFNMYGKDKPYPDAFNAAFFWSAATVFFPDLFFTLPCLLIVMLAYAAGNWHLWMSSISGIGTPYLLLAAFDFLSGQHILAENMAQIQVFGLPDFSSLPIVPGILLLFCVVLSFFSIISSRSFLQDLEMTERRKSSAMSIIIFYLLAFLLLSIGHVPVAHRFPLFFPAAFFCTKFIVYMRQSVLKEVLFVLILALSVLGVYL
ncbi:MAG: hypothetical protein NC048_05855 [Bacteroides sp.]|nr:hypothetical protein [Ruminococcus flavefaciens]MCM1555000.1 hypothetical protein [Bacteroides sp.]